MINDEENIKQLENNFVEKNCDIENYMYEKYKIYINIFKVISFFICILIIIIPVTKKNLEKTVQNKEKNQQEKPKEKKEPKPEEEINNTRVEKKNISQSVNLFISTHKDFTNKVLDNPAYKIICDDLTQLKNNYSLEIIPTDKNNILYPKRRAYGECAKMYYIWTLYKAGNISTKYVGFAHYRRVFEFKNNIPDLHAIFLKHDVILPHIAKLDENLYDQFRRNHIVHFLDESMDIIQEKFPEYYPTAVQTFSKKTMYFCNIFLMKKEDFIKWGEFVYGVVLELDKRYNLTSDEDIKKLITVEFNKYKPEYNIDYQSRLEGFLIERLSNVFFRKRFKKTYEISFGGL